MAREGQASHVCVVVERGEQRDKQRAGSPRCPLLPSEFSIVAWYHGYFCPLGT